MRLPSYKFSSSPPTPSPIDNVSTITPPPSPPPAIASSVDLSMTTPSTHHRIHLESPPPSLTPPRTRRGSTSTVPTITRSFNRPHSDSLPPPYEPPPPGSASTASLSAKRPTPERTPSVMVLFREDYQRTRVYVKEMDYRAALRKALRKHMYKWYALLVIVIVISILITTKHETIVNFCEPLTRRVRDWPAGWLIPVVFLIIVSFPPLFGHEIIGILCGLVWGLGVGFAILAAGTFFGEVATWVVFKWFCTARAAKFEKKNKLYASLTQTIREKSFMFVLVLRFSAVPGHITTAVSASAGANFWQYLAAAFLTLPKQFTIVYLGKAFGQKSTKNTIISVTTTILTLIGTVIAAIYIWYQMRIVMMRQAQNQACLSISRQVILEEEEETVGMNMAHVQIRRHSTIGTNEIVRIEGESDDVAQMLARRPWLLYASPRITSAASGSGSGTRTPSRTWSLPGPLSDEEMKEWMAGLESGLSTPKIRIEDAPINDEVGSSRRSASPDVPSVSYSQEPTTTQYVYPPLAARRYLYDTTYTPRETMSLDIERPRVGGRELADDADLYAIAKGARRPEYGRVRGESRAALLGRPDWSASGSDVDLSRAATWAPSRGKRRAEADNLDQARLGVSGVDKADYGRPRGDSGAALLGRPDE